MVRVGRHDDAATVLKLSMPDHPRARWVRSLRQEAISHRGDQSIFKPRQRTLRRSPQPSGFIDGNAGVGLSVPSAKALTTSTVRRSGRVPDVSQTFDRVGHRCEHGRRGEPGQPEGAGGQCIPSAKQPCRNRPSARIEVRRSKAPSMDTGEGSKICCKRKSGRP
jgi:hypothetical protein